MPQNTAIYNEILQVDVNRYFVNGKTASRLISGRDGMGTVGGKGTET
jgi:hypothetical protein